MYRYIYPFLACLFIFSALNSFGDEKLSEKLVIIITVDGLRADIIKKAYSPELFKLLKNSSYSLNTNTVSPSITTPAHLSLVSGLTPENHSVKTNIYFEGVKNFKSKTVFTSASKNGLKSGLIVGKEKLRLLIKGSENTYFEFIEYDNNSVRSIKEAALKYIIDNNPNLVLIHFPEPDLTGHKHNWISEEYLNKVREIDKSVYSMIEKILEKNSYRDFIIIITSDHGGIGNNHRIKNEKIQKIPLIILGKRIKKNNELDNEIYIYDIGPTVLDFLGFKVPSNLDGRTIENIYID